jgi:hypothetical protein
MMKWDGEPEFPIEVFQTELGLMGAGAPAGRGAGSGYMRTSRHCRAGQD